MHFKVPHKTTQVGAITKVRQAITKATSMLPKDVKITEQTWAGDKLNFALDIQGKSVTGDLQITNHDIVVNAKLPLLWRIFESKIEKMIAEQVAAIR